MESSQETKFYITVVIPAYNAGPFIARAIESALRQTHPADEIIVVDDGSTDNTAEAVRAFGDKVLLIQQQNAGASVARNTGINAARGNWIAFLDGDDEWTPEKLQRQTDLLKKNPDLAWTMSNYFVCFCDPKHSKTIYDQGRSETLLAGRDYYEDYFDSYKAGVCGNTNTMLIRKDVIFEAGLFRPAQPRINDEDLWFRIAYRYPKVGYLSTPLAIYHKGVTDSTMKRNNYLELVIDFVKRHLALAEENGRLDAFRPVARNITKFWIHWSWEDNRIYQIRLILKELGFLLPKGYKRAVYVLTIFPGLTLALMPLLRKINKVLKLGL